MKKKTVTTRQLVDWSSAMWAGLFSGGVFLILMTLVIPLVIGGNGWVSIRLLSSILLGSDILAPPATFDLKALIVGVGTHFSLSILFAMLLALITHRWGLITGVFVGAAFGAALFFANIYTLTILYPWFLFMKHPAFFVAHIIFGLTAGGVYELLEVEEFEDISS